MKDFDDIKEMWQQQPAADVKKADMVEVGRHTSSTKTKLKKQQLRGAIILCCTAVYIAWIGFFSGIHFQLAVTYIAILLMLAVILIQAVISLSIYRKLGHIDETLHPALHLKQWQDYYQFRKKQVRLNHPLYFIFLNLAFGLYFIEILSGRPFWGIVIVLTIYLAWMLFSYFVLGRRTLAREEKKLKTIIDGLTQVAAQLDAVE